MSILTDFNPKFLPFSLVGDVYIETGVCEGKSLINAMNAGFSRLHGIELLDRHIQTCRQAVRATGGRLLDIESASSMFFGRGEQVVQLIPGSSIRGGLQRAIGAVPGELLYTFFLDAHWPGEHQDEWEPCDGQCPLLEELKIILGYEWPISPTLVIDDCNQFASDRWWSEYRGPLERKQWPTFQDIYDLLYPAGFTMLMNDGILYAWR